METLTEYFTLSDSACDNGDSLKKLLTLFADEAVVTDNRGYVYRGRAQVDQFFNNFFTENVKLKHIFEVHKQENRVEVNWGVVGQKENSQKIFALTGTDLAMLNDQGKIINLRVTTDH
ncbi:nuclear transport factor 2 family protein [Lapidilactobacillus wuchangensis]|uniref:nuclear transport factor 2 family protein n=1 Tax=Lapidilactobacillus wuchangensis TaxID=2486001 RepID=UPI0013DDABF0|nr:nuclear transport factor 2 family protein [Lapidilactobacillus wuchangensis]